MILLVSYDLKVPGKNYNGLYNTLKSADSWWHYLESTWLLYTQYDVNYWYERIRQQTDPSDIFFVVEISKKQRQGWLPKEAWDWISKNDL